MNKISPYIFNIACCRDDRKDRDDKDRDDRKEPRGKAGESRERLPEPKHTVKESLASEVKTNVVEINGDKEDKVKVSGNIYVL